MSIQDGCDFRCTFCIIPFARGKSRSMETSSVIDKINEFFKLHEKIVVKPLDGMGGLSIYKFDQMNEENLNILNNMTGLEQTQIARIVEQIKLFHGSIYKCIQWNIAGFASFTIFHAKDAMVEGSPGEKAARLFGNLRKMEKTWSL